MPGETGEESGYSPDGGYYTHRDTLRNMSRLRGDCLVCCRVVTGAVMPEVEDGWMVCKCGNSVHVKNVVVWC